MKRKRRRPLAWLIPLAFAILTAVFAFLLTRPRPTGTSPAGPPSKSGPVAKKRMPPASSVPLAAIIIDDIGYSLEAVESIYAVGRPLTVAVLPDADLTEESARLAAACGLEVMLHLPLESNGNKTDPAGSGPAIREGKSRGEIRAEIDRCLARVPGARGLNNHEGSATTEKAELMRPILEILKERGLYFIDSRTTAATVALREAGRIGVRAAARRVFLDTERGDEAFAAGLRELFRSAKENGRAVAICHPKRESLAALARHVGLAESFGVRLVFASAVVE